MNKVLQYNSILALIVSPMVGFSQAEEPAGNVIVEIPGNISDGKPSPPAPPPELPEFEVKSTVVHEMDVVEGPPMSGLPLVEGTITATINLVEDPNLPDPPKPLPPPDDPGIHNPFPEGRWKNPIRNISATVYDHSRTLLRYHPNGYPNGHRDDTLRKETIVWSNLDFNHFSGFSIFEVKDAGGILRRYVMMTMIFNEDTQKRAELFAKRGKPYQPLKMPELPDGAPAYVIESASPDGEAMQFIEDLHQLYRNEGPRMEEAYHARVKAEAERRAWFIAHPPVPANVTMNFWERSHPVHMSPDTIKKGGGN